MNDKLPLLRKIAQTKGIRIEAVLEVKEETAAGQNMKEFAIKISLAQGYVKDLVNCNLRLRQIKYKLSTVSKGTEKDISEVLDNIIDYGSKSQKKAKFSLDDIENEVRESKNDNSKSQDTRIKANLYGATIKYFEESLQSFKTHQLDIKNLMTSNILRSAEIVMNQKLDEETKAKVIANPGMVTEYFNERLTSGTSHINMQNAVRDLEDRHKEILKLENSVEQMHKMFVDLATLVKLQGDIVNNIEDNIKQAKDFTLEAEVDIFKSHEHMKSARRKKCIIMIIVLVVLVLIILPILGVKLFKT